MKANKGNALNIPMQRKIKTGNLGVQNILFYRITETTVSIATSKQCNFKLNDKKFDKVRTFMNGKLELDQALSIDVLSAKLEESLKNEFSQRFVMSLVEERLDAMLTFMLKIIKMSNERKLSLITCKSKHGYNALHFASKYSTLAFFKQLWSCIESFSGADERIELLLSVGYSGATSIRIFCITP